MARRLEVEIVADAAKYSRGLKDAESNTRTFARAAGVAGLAVAGGLVVALKKSVDAAMESQRVNAQTQAQLKALGINYQAHAKQINDVIQSTSRLAAIDDEDLQGAFNQLVRATGNVNEGLRATALAADVSRGAHISLERAERAVIGAEEGRSTMLKRLGVDIDASASKQEILTALQAKFAGAAKAYGDTAAGSQERFHIALQNVEETIGGALLPVITKVTNVVATLTQRVADSEKAHNALATVGRVLKAVFELVGQTIQNVTAVVMKHKDEFIALGNFLNATLVPLMRFVFTQVIPVVIDVAIKEIDLIITAISGIVRAVKTMSEGAVTAFNGFKATVTGVASFVSNTVGDIVGYFRGMPGRIGAAITAGADVIQKAVKDLFGKVIGWVKGVLGISSPSAVFHEIGQNVVKGFANGVGSMAGVLKNAVVHLAEKYVTGPIAAAGHAIGGVIHGGGASPSGNNQSLGQRMMLGAGWGMQEWPSLQALWTRESGWSQYAYNASSGATGIPQALPYTKMPRAAWLPSQGGRADPAAQIGWGLSYIRGRYGSPSAAWAHELKYGWYDKGGVLPPGVTLAINKTGKDELIIPTDDLQAPGALPPVGNYTPVDTSHLPQEDIQAMQELGNKAAAEAAVNIGVKVGTAITDGADQGTDLAGVVSDAKQAADDFVDNTGIANMLGKGKALGDALGNSFGDSLDLTMGTRLADILHKYGPAAGLDPWAANVIGHAAANTIGGNTGLDPWAVNAINNNTNPGDIHIYLDGDEITGTIRTKIIKGIRANGGSVSSYFGAS